MVATWYGGRQPSPILAPSQSAQRSGCARVTGKAGENGQSSVVWAARSPWTRPSAPGCGGTFKAFQGGDRRRRRLQGRHRTVVLSRKRRLNVQSGSRTDCTHCGKKAWSVRALPPVTVDTEQVPREAGGPVSGCTPNGIPRQGGQVVALGCARQEMGKSLSSRAQRPSDSNWIQSYPTKNKTAQDTMKFFLQKVVPPDQKPRINHTFDSLDFFSRLWRLLLDHDKSTPYRSETNGIAEYAVRRVKEGTSTLMVQLGLSEKWWGEALKFFCSVRNMQDKLAERKSPCGRRFGTPFDGSVIPYGAEICFDPISTKDKSRHHQFGTMTLPGISIGHAPNFGGGWTGDLIIADWDIENNVASEVHVRFKSKEVGMKRLQEAFISPCADGSQRHEGHAQRQTLRHQRVESFCAGGVPSTLGEARGDPLQSARDNSWQEKSGVAHCAEADRDAMKSQG